MIPNPEMFEIMEKQGEIRLALINDFGIAEELSDDIAADVMHRILVSGIASGRHHRCYVEMLDQEELGDEDDG